MLSCSRRMEMIVVVEAIKVHMLTIDTMLGEDVWGGEGQAGRLNTGIIMLFEEIIFLLLILLLLLLLFLLQFLSFLCNSLLITLLEGFVLLEELHNALAPPLIVST